MSDHKITWLNMPGYKGETWNPIVGCSKISEGCDNCYAEKMAARITAAAQKKEGDISWSQRAYLFASGNGKWSGNTMSAGFKKPYMWKSPRMIFVCSMGDIFHETVETRWLHEIFKIIIACPQHVYIILTKRPERAKEYFKWNPQSENLPNVWLGVTAENQQRANERIPILLQIAAAKHFVSIEPMLGPVNLNIITEDDAYNWLTGETFCAGMNEPCISNKLDWVICGGETGPKARPMHPDWARSLRDQCKAAQVPFFFKQWGEWYTRWGDITTGEYKFKFYESYQQFTQKLWVGKGDACIDLSGKVLKCGGDFKNAAYPVCIMQRTGHKAAGRRMDGVEYNEFPESK